VELRKNLFRKGLVEKTTLYGCWLGIPDPTVAELAAGADYDWLLIDHEHAPFELSDVMAHLRAMSAYPVEPIVRPVDSSPSLLKKLLELGTQTFLVPMVDTAEQAKACAAALFFPPRGVRGVGSSLARAARWNQVDNYLKTADEEICLLVQAETVTALENLDEIVAVEGVDGVFLGPSDLAASMGHLGNPSHPEVVAAIEAAIRTIRAAGKAAGILTLDPSAIASYRGCGANFIGVGVDTLLIGNGFRDRIAAVRETE
jgi:4-hydroxy-2-oxoheptanedioate aldolase